MKLPHDLLVPCDFSEPSEVALDYAIAIAGKLDAVVHLLTVVEIEAFHFSDLGTAMSAEVIEMFVSGNQTALERLAEARRSTGRIGEVLLRTGDPRDVIDQLARQTKTDLIVMGTHGRRGWKRLMLGSVAEAILRTAPCPVLTVRPPR